ncbi:MAG: hypothetical protein HGA80_00540 [Candidatus Omnitrophica bacterium]|nr:hypothetical protein [Candidatus Omnitrophota bacterium]
MRAVLRLLIIGATFIGLLAFLLNHEFGQHIIADFFSMFHAKEIQAQAKDFTQSSKQAEALLAESRKQQEEFQELLQERQILYSAKIEQMHAAREKLNNIKAGGGESDIERLKEMIRRYKELDKRWSRMDNEVVLKADALRDITERTRRWMDVQKAQQARNLDRANTLTEQNRDRANNIREKMMDKARSQQDELRDKMDALRERMHR